MLGLLIATLGGTAVGLERQWSGHADGPRARLGGIRTFTMLGALAGLSGFFWTHQLTVPAAILLTGAVLVVVIAYAVAAREDIDATTEVAALVVIAAGVLAGTGALQLASAIIAILSLLLVEKSRLHAFVRTIDDVELRAAAYFSAMALVVLPLLPPGPFGPLGGVRPRELWILVLFFSGLSFVGYVARRLVGPGAGYLATGFLGGMVSSTNVTWMFARGSRANAELGAHLSAGAIAANAVLFPRVLLAASVLHPPLFMPLALELAAPALVTAMVAVVAARRPDTAHAPPAMRTNPLQLRSALQMALLFQVVLMTVYAARAWWGNAGVLTSAAILGLTDVDALTMSMSRGLAATIGVETAATAIGVGVLANTLLKLSIALVFGSAQFRARAGGTLALAAGALAIGLFGSP